MRYTPLGGTGLRVSELCLGTMTFDESLAWGASKEESRAVYEAFVEAGGNFVDTHTYGPTEDYLGEFLGAGRDRVVLATKYGGTIEARDTNAGGGNRKSMVRSVERSLRRLKTDYIDLLWLHAWDELTPVAEILRAGDDLVRSGKVLYLGVANAPAWAVARANTIAELRGWTPYAAMQVEYSLVERDVDRDIMPMARALDIGVAAWTPLASGWLTGKYMHDGDGDGGGDGAANGNGAVAAARRLDDPMMARFMPRNERNVAIATEVCAVADELGCAPAHVALNWLRRRGAIPIFGARSAVQVEQNAGCFDHPLSDDQVKRLTAVSRIKLGFPHDFLASGIVRKLMYGQNGGSIDRHPQPGAWGALV
jgi:aryl-alcohol dehydrogenase-like predicted oxidoreductase